MLTNADDSHVNSFLLNIGLAKLDATLPLFDRAYRHSHAVRHFFSFLSVFVSGTAASIFATAVAEFERPNSAMLIVVNRSP